MRALDPDVSALIMAGGASSRLGTDKATLRCADGTPLLVSIARVLACVAGEVIVVAGSASRCALLASVVGLDTTVIPVGQFSSAPVAVRWLPDDSAFHRQGPLGGLYSGLRAARGSLVLAVGCDMPFLAAPLLRLMITAMEDRDILLPLADGHLQPLHAVYRRDACVGPAERQLHAGRLSLSALCTDPCVRVSILDDRTVRRGDPTARSWLGINTPSEMERAGLRPLTQA